MYRLLKYIILNMVYGISIILIFVACNEEVEIPGEDNLVYFSDLRYPLTRTSMAGGQASFTTNDKIGIFETLTGKTNILYTYNSTWTTATPMYWKDATSQHTFYAYYPYNTNVSGNAATIPILTSQTTSSAPDPNSDLLVSSLSTSKKSPINLSFTHAFAILKFNVSFASGLLSSLLPGKIYLNGGNPSTGGFYGMFNKVNDITKINYNLSTKALTNSVNDNTVFQQSFSATLPNWVSKSATIYILILPGTYTNPTPNAKFAATILISGLELTSTAQSLATNTFLPNTMYEYNVVLLQGGTRAMQSSDSLQAIITPYKIEP